VIARGFEPLIDRTEIYAFEDWWQRIQALIGRADTIVFVLSPDAVTSDVALKEVSHGAALNKRFAPIVCRRVEDPAVPEPLRQLNFIFFDDPDRFEASTDQLSEALTTDIGWVRQHTDYGEAARHWVAAGRSGGLLLRSPALEEAERWIASRPHGAPEPTGDTQTFVAESWRGATRRRNILTGSAEMTSRPHPSPSRMSTTAYSGALSLICAKPSSTDFGGGHIEASSFHRPCQALRQLPVVFDNQHRSGPADWSQALLKCTHHRDPPQSLVASFYFACWVTELVQKPRANLCFEFDFAWRRAFLGMRYLTWSAFKYVQVG